MADHVLGLMQFVQVLGLGSMFVYWACMVDHLLDLVEFVQVLDLMQYSASGSDPHSTVFDF